MVEVVIVTHTRLKILNTAKYLNVKSRRERILPRIPREAMMRMATPLM